MLRPTIVVIAAALGGCQQASAPPSASAANIISAVEHAQAQADNGSNVARDAARTVGIAR